MNEKLLKKHFEDAPRMEPQDAVKLAYQSAFGCGHLLPAHDVCSGMIERETAAVPLKEVPAFTPIGNGLCRLNLAAESVRMLGSDMIARMMRVTDEIVRERSDLEDRFQQAVSLITRLAQRGEAPFSEKQLEDYLTAYRGAGSPVVSHTPAYREAYQPSYRVVLTDLALLVPVLVQKRKVIVIDGPCGSGKTTLAGLLARLYGTEAVPMDDFFLPFHLRTSERLAQPGGNVHYERFLQEVLNGLQPEKPVCWNRFNCSDGTLLPRCLPEAETILIEGSYSHHPVFRQSYERLHALLVFVTVEPEEQLRRIARRDPELRHMFETRWIPLEKSYFKAYDIQGTADVVVASKPWKQPYEKEETH